MPPPYSYLLVFLALGAAYATRDCESCSAGSACGMCLVLVPSSECPTGPGRFGTNNGLAPGGCLGVGVGQLCEADGECGTDNDADNCDVSEEGFPVPGWWGKRGGRDIYRRESCVWTTPRPPPPPPPPPRSSCEFMGCDAGASCGLCLQKLPAAECPAFWASSWMMHTCGKVPPGELCEAVGECGTTEIDNCNGIDSAGKGRRLGRGNT